MQFPQVFSRFLRFSTVLFTLFYSSLSFSNDTAPYFDIPSALEIHTQQITTQSTPRGTVLIDINNDGLLDIVNGTSTKLLHAHIKNQDGSYTTSTIASSTAAITAIFAADLDGDEFVDMFTRINDNLVWLKNLGNGSFTQTIISPVKTLRSVEVIDVDKDDFKDIVISAHADSEVTIFFNNGNHTFSPQVIDNNASKVWQALVQDVDKDGDLDLLSASTFDNVVAWYEQTGPRTFNKHIIFDGVDTSTNSTRTAKGLCVVDVDKDLDNDVISISHLEQKIRLHINNGSQVFTNSVIGSTIGLPNAIGCHDIDNDGDNDFVISTDTGSLLYKNDGSANFSVTQALLGNGSKVLIADAFGDMNVDILIPDETNGLIMLHRQAKTVDVAVLQGMIDVIDLNAIDPDGDNISYSLGHTEDTTRFNINSLSGLLQFNITTNVNAPIDNDGDNVYKVMVLAKANGETAALALNVLVDIDTDSDGVLDSL